MLIKPIICNYIIINNTAYYVSQLVKKNLQEKKIRLRFYKEDILILGKGQNYEFHNVEIQKERRKKFKASER